MYCSRSQTDTAAQHAEHAPTLFCPPAEDRTRQEFRDETDVNLLLQRYGAAIPQKPVQYGEVDFDLDLHTAYGAFQRVREGFNSLVPMLRDKYPTLDELVAAIATGEVISKDGQLVEKPVAPPPVALTPHLVV